MRQPGSGHPPFATFELEEVEKADGREVHYYTWAAAPDGDPEPEAADASDAVEAADASDAVEAVDATPRPTTPTFPSERSDRV